VNRRLSNTRSYLFKCLDDAGKYFQNDDTKSGLEIFTKLSPGIQNAVYGCTYELEKNSHPAVGNPRFGELAFLQKEGLDVSNATRATIQSQENNLIF